jgi:GTP-binding protein
LQRPPCNSFIFFGRSNIGKSSLINKLIGVPVNETSKQPGKTKELVFLRLNTVQRTYFVDAPGYGYASAASKQEIRSWGKLVEQYLKNTSKGE